MKFKKFQPEWTDAPAPEGSYRSAFKYGDPWRFKHPNKHWFEMFKNEFGLSDSDFKQRREEGLEQVKLNRPASIDTKHVNKFKEIVGEENVKTDDFSRLKYSYGKSAEDALEIRKGVIRELSDLAVLPRNKEDVRKIVEYCNANKIPIYTYGAGTGVVFGSRPVKAGISVVMSAYMNKVVGINEINQTATVQPGILGPEYERILNDAPGIFGAKKRYTCGHFPQSFEYASVGGWILALGSGQASTYYGDAADIVLSQEYVTPAGCFKTLDYASTATGPKVNDIMKGSEGAFGILVEAKMKIFRYAPENRRYFDFMFPTWEAAVEAGREVVQGEFGKPAVFRMSDPEETDRGLKLFGVVGWLSKAFEVLGYKPMQRCLMMGTAEGDAGYTNLVKSKIKKICKAHGALYIGGIGAKRWEHTRYTEPFMREDLNDYGIVVDTLETAVAWDNVLNLHKGVREFVKSRPGTVCMTHASHFYPQSTNLYFILIFKPKDLNEYIDFKKQVIDKIVEFGGSTSHHHGTGRMFAPWIERHLGKEQMDVLRALKKHFDPNDIMNPGGLLGLD